MLGEAPVVDVDHVLGPLASREVRGFLDPDQPVVEIVGPDHEESRLLLDDGQLPDHLQVEFVHGGLDPDLDLAVLHEHLVGAQLDIREG